MRRDPNGPSAVPGVTAYEAHALLYGDKDADRVFGVDSTRSGIVVPEILCAESAQDDDTEGRSGMKTADLRDGRCWARTSDLRLVEAEPGHTGLGEKGRLQRVSAANGQHAGRWSSDLRDPQWPGPTSGCAL